jgi:hypothetical protein
MPTIHPDRRPAAAARLARALEVLSQSHDDNRCTQGATLSALCRLASVSRNSVYRYHPVILAALRVQQGRPATDPAALPSTQTVPATDYPLLQEQLSRLAALVDHYYAAYREARVVIERRERELAELKRKFRSAPVRIPHNGHARTRYP